MADKELLPNCLDLEQALVSILITTPDLKDELLGLVSAGDFYDPRHATIWRAVQALNGQLPDVLTLLDFLGEKGPRFLKAAGGQDYILDLACSWWPMSL